MEYIKEFFKVMWQFIVWGVILIAALFMLLLPVILADFVSFSIGGAVLGLYFLIIIGAWSYDNVRERRRGNR